jgi:hypothetical protein
MWERPTEPLSGRLNNRPRSRLHHQPAKVPDGSRLDSRPSGEQAYRLLASREGFLHELPEGSSRIRCGQWSRLELKPATTKSRFCSACGKASAATAVQGSLDFGQ